ncbi:MAG: hypothetical protein SF066_03575 [Thermoanaerobaculia bacterium]|nr:hypothetical protein [Thermoanaerobaculia bacterium]
MRKALLFLLLVLTFGCGEETVVPANPPAQPAAATAPVPPPEDQQAKPKNEIELEPGEKPPTM